MAPNLMNLWFGETYGPKPYEFIRFGEIYGPKLYEFIGFGEIGAESGGAPAPPDPPGWGAPAWAYYGHSDSQMTDFFVFLGPGGPGRAEIGLPGTPPGPPRPARSINF